MASPSMYFGQYRRFLVTADKKIPTDARFNTASMTQKPQSIMTTLPECAMDLDNCNSRPEVFLSRETLEEEFPWDNLFLQPIELST
jgi:hypothetical protein